MIQEIVISFVIGLTFGLYVMHKAKEKIIAELYETIGQDFGNNEEEAKA
jgi:hypothetical protein